MNSVVLDALTVHQVPIYQILIHSVYLAYSFVLNVLVLQAVHFALLGLVMIQRKKDVSHALKIASHASLARMSMKPLYRWHALTVKLDISLIKIQTMNARNAYKTARHVQTQRTVNYVLIITISKLLLKIVLPISNAPDAQIKTASLA